MIKKKKKNQDPQAGQDEAVSQEELAQQSGSAPLLVHLQALRRVLIVSAVSVAAAFFLVYYLAIEVLMAWIIHPIEERGIQIIYTSMSEALVTKFKVALTAALIHPCVRISVRSSGRKSCAPFTGIASPS